MIHLQQHRKVSPTKRTFSSLSGYYFLYFLLYLYRVVWLCWASAETQGGGASHPGYFLGYGWRECTGEITWTHAAAGQSSVPAYKPGSSLFCLSYFPVALKCLMPHPTQRTILQNTNICQYCVAQMAFLYLVVQGSFVFSFHLHLCLFPVFLHTQVMACWDPDVQAHVSSCICWCTSALSLAPVEDTDVLLKRATGVTGFPYVVKVHSPQLISRQKWIGEFW